MSTTVAGAVQAIADVLIVVGLVYLIGTLTLARRKRPVATFVGGQAVQRVIFVVPALDEEQVIASTIDSLLEACGTVGRVLVIDDGSTDATAAIVAGYSDPRVRLLQRRAPHARHGKGKALNHAYRVIRDEVEDEGLDAARVVLGIVDADGRLEPHALRHVSPYFSDRRVGAVQLLVRIRNRSHLLARFQDYEFLVFSSLTQTAREKVGSVGLGGNGQFTRLAALMDLGAEPWSDCLTEDLDLGVRLAIAGWENRFCGETYVDQQGLTSLRRLVRQRTRWAQGHLQCWRLIPGIVASQLPTLTVLDLVYYLLAPAFVLAASLLFTLPVWWTLSLVLLDPGAWLTPTAGVFLGLMYLFSFGPAIYLALVYWRRARDLSFASALLLGHLLGLYNYLWYLAEWKALARILTRRGGWAKTARSVESGTSPSPSTRSRRRAGPGYLPRHTRSATQGPPTRALAPAQTRLPQRMAPGS